MQNEIQNNEQVGHMLRQVLDDLDPYGVEEEGEWLLVTNKKGDKKWKPKESNTITIRTIGLS